MERRPLAQDFGQRARIDDLVGRDTRELVRGDVAHAVAAGLDRVHLDFGQFGQDVGRVLQPDPVELDVLPRGEVSIAAVVPARDVRQRAHLRGRQQAVGDRDAQHGRMALDIQAVAQAQRAELVLAQLPGEKALHLVAVLGHPFEDERAVDGVVAVHAGLSSAAV